MADQRPDRRVGRTRRLLKEALLELLAEREYARITVEDLTSRADVGRSTFYSHYGSKEDLLFAGFEDWLLSIATSAPVDGAESDARPGARAGARSVSGRRPRFRFSLPLLHHIGTQKAFFRSTILEASRARVRRKSLALLASVVETELARIEGEPEAADRTRRSARAHAIAAAYLGLVAWWLDGGARLEPVEVDRIFQDTAGPRGADPRL